MGNYGICKVCGDSGFVGGNTGTVKCSCAGQNTEDRRSGIVPGYMPGLSKEENEYYHRLAKMPIDDITEEQFEDYKVMNDMIIKAMLKEVSGI